MSHASGLPGSTPTQAESLVALIVGHVCLHSCMAGVRLAAPLQVLREGYAEWAVGALLGLFALAPMLVALPAGRHVDRRGIHRPMRVAVTLSVCGGLVAVASPWMAAGQFAMLCISAALTGAGSTYGLIAVQRTAGRGASGSTELKRVFSWLGLAPAAANVVGPVLAGLLVDGFGFVWAYLALTLVPLISLLSVRRVAAEPRLANSQPRRKRDSLDLLRAPGVARLLLVNLLLSASWDVHAFLVPIIGHARGFSASAIGVILGAFGAAVTFVRLLIPALAHRLSEARVLVIAMLVTGALLGVYPLLNSPWAMGVCAALLGLALGTVQPMILSTLHQLTPQQRHGEAIALRTMTIGLASTVMPLLFGAAGAAVGAASLFWAMGFAVALGSTQVRATALAVARADPNR